MLGWAHAEADGGGNKAQRYLSCKNENHALASGVWALAVQNMIRSWPWFVAALASLVLYPTMADPEMAYPTMIADLLPSGVRGLLVGLAGRDWHGPDQEDCAGERFPVAAVLCDRKEPDEILDRIRKGRVILTMGPVLRLSAEAMEGEVTVGGALRLGPREKAGIRLEVLSASGRSCTAFLVRDGRAVRRWKMRGRSEIRLETATGLPGRYRAEVWSEEGEPVAISNHILISRCERT